MTVVTVIAAGDVSRMLSGRRQPVVTGAAPAQHLGVINGDHWHPDRIVVAVLADIGGEDVGRILAGSLAAVVAGYAIVGDTGVIEIGRQPGNRRVTIIAVSATGNVGRVFPGRGDAIVTGATGTQDMRVIDPHDRLPQTCGVAVFAGIRRLNMCRTFAGCGCTVVAPNTVSDNFRVIENSGHPGIRGVTVFA